MGFFDFLTGSDEASRTIADATKRATKFLKEGQAKSDAILLPGSNYQPIQSRLYNLYGVNGAQAQEDAFGDYRESPEVAFYREQGEEAALRAASAGGHLASSRTLKDVGRFNQGVAMGSYGDYTSRLSGLYDRALAVAGQRASGYTQNANSLANITAQGGQARAGYDAERFGMGGSLLSQGAVLGSFAAGGGFSRPPGMY